MSNILRIKRRVSGTTDAPASLESGALAFNEVNQVLWYGAGNSGGMATAVIAIAGFGAFVSRASDQSIDGVKSFTSFPVGPSSAPTSDYQFANKKYVDDAVIGAGAGDMTKSVYDPQNIADDAFDRANHTGTQAQSTITNLVTDLAAKAPLASPTFTGTPAAPTATEGTNSTQVATTAFVMAAIASLALSQGKKFTVRAATTGNITIASALNNGDQIDGVTLATGDYVLVKNQSTGSQNGIYVVGVTPVRAPEFDAYNELVGATFTVQEGTTQADQFWYCTSNGGGTIDSTALTFAQLRISGELLAANNLSDIANAGTARGNLGLGTIATQNANAVAITGGSITGLTTFDNNDIDAGTF